jgi:DNA-binding NtrC family response regulator
MQSDIGCLGAGRELVLLVSASADDACVFRQLVDAARWMVVNVSDLSGACAVLEKRYPKLVVCDADIDGPGSWRDLLKLRGDPLSFAVVVASRNADDALWAEVLNLGGFDLLQKPFNAEGVHHALSSWLASRQERTSVAYKGVLSRARWNESPSAGRHGGHESVQARTPKAGDG